jgi:hypothetical protein
LFLRKNGTACPDGLKIPVMCSVFLPDQFIIKAHYLSGLTPGCQREPETHERFLKNLECQEGRCIPPFEYADGFGITPV